jgi:hypothetical protein
MFDNVKTTAIVGVSALVVGAVGTAILLPTKIETKVETKVEIKEVEKKVVIDRTIKRKIDKDGSVTEDITEKDRSIEDSKSTIDESKSSTVVTNPKELTVKVQGKTSITDPTLPTTGDLGVGIDYDVGHGVEVGGSVFKDGTVTFGIGFSF